MAMFEQIAWYPFVFHNGSRYSSALNVLHRQIWGDIVVSQAKNLPAIRACGWPAGKTLALVRYQE